jgi:hypothetical protein
MTDKELEKLWQKFGDIPIDEHDEILEKFMDWNIGTDRFVIWHWFDKEHTLGVNFLLGLRKDISNA